MSYLNLGKYTFKFTRLDTHTLTILVSWWKYFFSDVATTSKTAKYLDLIKQARHVSLLFNKRKKKIPVIQVT